MAEKKAKQTLTFEKDIRVASFGNIVGKFEGEGPLGDCFDMVVNDEYFGEKTYEKAEVKLQKTALKSALDKGGLEMSALDVISSGDLLNQCLSSSYSVRDSGVPYIGLFGACSTMALSSIISGMAIECGFANYAAGVTSSHFCTAERQFRQPLEYGGQRTPGAQRTATAGAAIVYRLGGSGVRLNRFTLGSVIDYQVYDPNNMGAAMAPAAADTLCRFFEDTGSSPNDFDLILSGDLGSVGSSILVDMAAERGVVLGNNYNDCGLMLFDIEKQDVHAGGSGCGCGGAVLTGHILPKIVSGELKNVLFMATGALMSPTASFQGESIPSIAHLINFTGE